MEYSYQKKAWHQTVETLHHKSSRYSIGALCVLFGYSRQAYYQHQDEDYEKEVSKSLYVDYVKEVREQASRMGCVKLYNKCQEKFGEMTLGRDSFVRLLSERGLQLRIRRRRTKTTDSTHGFRVYPNLIKEFTPTAPNQLWVSDITYIHTHKGFCYLSLITDAYSRRIMGYKLAPTLQCIHTQEALQMAIDGAQERGESIKELIHHSDRGVQYASYSYIKSLNANEIKISMTENGDPLENAIAERVNGILKQEWLNAYDFENMEQVLPVLDRIITFYNHQRPHASINMMTPVVAHQQLGEIKRCWKNYYSSRNVKQSENNV